MIGFDPCGSALYVEAGHWFFSIYADPRRWGIGFHRNAACCKAWLLVGPFEINRAWSDEDAYPFDYEDIA